MAVARTAPSASETHPPVRLRHLPGRRYLPVVGQTLDYLRDPLRFTQQQFAKCGPVSRVNFLFRDRACLLSPDANELVLRDRAQNFSAHHGWTPVIGDLFPHGLMLRDGADHRQHRRLMQPAFRAEALADYLLRMQPHIRDAAARWHEQPALSFYPEVKRLTLAIAADCFLGLELQSEIDAVNVAFTDVVEASTAVVRQPIPIAGRKYARGLTGRRFLEDFLEARIPARRQQPGSDLFSQLCAARDEDGNSYSDEDVVNHMIFLMMAAHDTTTSALTTIVYALARHPEWQSRLRDEAHAIDAQELPHNALDAVANTGLVLREALRLYPPLSTIVREAIDSFSIDGFEIPAGASVSVFPIFTQRDPQWWDAPESFDPERFGPERAEHKRHGFAWVPFGGGAHTCLGLHFAEMQVKAIMHVMLRTVAWSVPEGYRMPYQLAPIAKPRDGLPIKLRAIG